MLYDVYACCNAAPIYIAYCLSYLAIALQYGVIQTSHVRHHPLHGCFSSKALRLDDPSGIVCLGYGALFMTCMVFFVVFGFTQASRCNLNVVGQR
jgi:hypothetical protein